LKAERRQKWIFSSLCSRKNEHLLHRKYIELSRRIFYGAKLAKLFLRRVTAGAGLFLRRVTAGAEEETVTAVLRCNRKAMSVFFYAESIYEIHSFKIKIHPRVSSFCVLKTILLPFIVKQF
jgi:hypothetical protein